MRVVTAFEPIDQTLCSGSNRYLSSAIKKATQRVAFFIAGGERGIRTLDGV